MPRQYSNVVRDAKRQAHETAIGTSPKFLIFDGTMPANCATADAGTLLATLDLPSDWLSHDGAGGSSKLGTWQATAGAPGTSQYYRIYDTGLTTCHEQGKLGESTVIATNGTTAANDNVLNFADTTGVSVGDKAVGTGIPDNSEVLAATATTVTLSRATTAGVGSGVNVTFSAGDAIIDNATIVAGQQITVTAYAVTEAQA